MKAYPLTQFSDLGLAATLLAALRAEGYERPTPIQAKAIPAVMSGRDLLGVAQTGTGKTAAFALPILDRLSRAARAAGRRGPRAHQQRADDHSTGAPGGDAQAAAESAAATPHQSDHAGPVCHPPE